MTKLQNTKISCISILVSRIQNKTKKNNSACSIKMNKIFRKISWIRKINFVNTVIHPKLIPRFNRILRIPADFFIKIDSWVVKSIENSKRPRIIKTTLKKKNKIGRLTFLDFKICYKVTLIKAGYYWQRKDNNGLELIVQNQTCTFIAD